MLKQINSLGIEKTTPDNTDIIPIQQADGITRHITRANFLTGASVAQQYPEEFTHFHDQSIVVTGNAIKVAVSSSYIYNVICYQNPPAINDSFRFQKLLAAGTYKLNILGTIGNLYGKISVYLNGIKITEIDMYAASNTLNYVKSQNIVIPASGIQTFLLEIESKNSSSTNYFAYLQKFWAYKI